LNSWVVADVLFIFSISTCSAIRIRKIADRFNSDVIMAVIGPPILALTTCYQAGICWQLVDNKNSPINGGVSILVSWTD
jgi:hypothetical protein